MARRTISGRRILVTGASSGIGYQLALELARQGAKLVLTARRQERLEELSTRIRSDSENESVVFLAGDITSANHREQVLKMAVDRFGGLDVVVNNAGVGAVGPFVDADPHRLEQLFGVNLFAPAELIRLAVPLLKQADHPAIVNIGSVLAFTAVPKKSEYCATKFALRAFSDALRVELSSDKIDVISVHPNTTESEFFDRLIEKKGKVATNPAASSAKSVARQVVRSIEKGKPETILTLSGRAMIWMNSLFPGCFRWLLRRFG